MDIFIHMSTNTLQVDQPIKSCIEEKGKVQNSYRKIEAELQFCSELTRMLQYF